MLDEASEASLTLASRKEDIDFVNVKYVGLVSLFADGFQILNRSTTA
jgi:hypothetical protein